MMKERVVIEDNKLNIILSQTCGGGEGGKVCGGGEVCVCVGGGGGVGK